MAIGSGFSGYKFNKNFHNHSSRVLVEGKINYNVRKGEHGNIHFTNITAGKIILYLLMELVHNYDFFVFRKCCLHHRQ